MKDNPRPSTKQRRYRDTDEVWQAVEEKLHYAVEPSIRNDPDIKECVEKVIEGKGNRRELFADLIRVVKRLRKMVAHVVTERKQMAANRPPKSTKRYNRHPQLSNRHVIRTTSEMRDLQTGLLAHDMANEESVINFRKSLLEDRLLARYEAEHWISIHRPKGTYMSDVLIDMEMDWEGDDDNYWDFAPRRREVDHEIHTDPAYMTSVREKIAEVGGEDSPLGRLILVGAEISGRSGWLLSEAIWFILTGEPPRIPTLLATPIHRGRNDNAVILMEVDPEVSPDDVRLAYKKLRDRMKVRTSHRPPDPRTIAFMRFVLEKDGVDPRRPKRLAPLVDEWNKLESTKEQNWIFDPSERRRISEIYFRALERIKPRLPDEYWVLRFDL